MDAFSEELMRSVEDDDQVEASIGCGPEIHLPWLSQHLQNTVSHGHKGINFAQTTSICLNFIQEALLKHQWQRASEFLQHYFQALEDFNSQKRQVALQNIWKLGSAILYHHPKSNVETFNAFADRMKNIGVQNYLKISLQHALYLLHKGMVEEAYRNLNQAESWRYGEMSASQEKIIKLIQAYRGLLDYYTWSKKRTELSKFDMDGFATSAATQDMHSYFRQASVNLHEIIKIPGVWDPFVKSYVEMLEFYGDQDGARQVLTDYAYDNNFPSNPNAHIYLYKFLKKEKAPEDKLISVLKILHQIVPSHKIMLEFHMLLRKSKKEEHQKLGLEVLFAVLDFSGCTENITAWKYLAKYLKQIMMEKHLNWVQEGWSSRKDWWPTFHFSYYLAKKNWKENKILALEKAFTSGILLGKGCKYFMYVSKQGHKVQKKSIKTMKKFVMKHNILDSEEL
ncbi:TATA box-binding protein-associated factor RNA polymerase I subunit A-like [Vombatus ursinus]|uniref:TATA-box binding protein associated factor, RNA polymerase I subunit A n=1 Tax=Vombatus ursinus TaxID=29139 RepID=A0A4X2LIW2_VOMUR|nr:TATA box-binding protein-associated factor RNA polymerase I subunit A-like [Vombatus ursinus]XP_027727695.1 TATA box-binding protein-associated factor RNA polymerase I subunit A-like [Vombatus ursinus]